MLAARFCTKLFTLASSGCLDEASALTTYRYTVVDAD
jgi:hypothetical protein